MSRDTERFATLMSLADPLCPGCGRSLRRQSHAPYCGPACLAQAKRRERHGMHGGYCYIIYDSSNDACKLGYTTTTIVARLRALQTGHPAQLTVAHTICSPDPKATEQKLHAKFAAYQIRAEWYQWPPVKEWLAAGAVL